MTDERAFQVGDDPRDARIAELEAALALVTAQLDEVREACHSALSSPEAHRGRYTFMEYRPYEEILDIVDPPAEDPTFQSRFVRYLDFLKMSVPPFLDFNEWDAAQSPDAAEAE